MTATNPNTDLPANPFHVDNPTPSHDLDLHTIRQFLPPTFVDGYWETMRTLSPDERETRDRDLAQRLIWHDQINEDTQLDIEFDPLKPADQYRRQLGFYDDVEPLDDGTDGSQDVEPPRQLKLDLAQRKPPEFPYDILPDPIRNLIDFESVAKNGHPDMSAVAALGVMSAMANQLGITVDDGLGWVQRLNLFLLVAGFRGEGKSPVFKRMMQPLDRLAEEVAKDHRRKASHDKAEHRRLEEKLKRAQINASGANAGEMEITLENEAQETIDEFERTMTRGQFRMHIGGDTTPEGFLHQLAANKGVVSVFDDEGGFFKKMTKYSDVIDVAAYLKCWDGGMPESTRVGKFLQVPNANAVFMLMVQPDIVTTALANPEIVDSGLADRFLIAAPHTKMGERNHVGRRNADPKGSQAFDGYIEDIWNRFNGRTTQLLCAEDAVLYFDEYRDRLEATIDPTAITEGERAYSKRHASVLRIAGLLHVMWGGSAAEFVTLDTMKDAIRLSDYFIEHYECFTGSDETPEQEAVRRLLAWAKRRRNRPFTLRQVNGSKCVRPAFSDTDGVRELFATLIADGIIETDDPEGWHIPKNGSVATTFWIAEPVDNTGDDASHHSSSLMLQNDTETHFNVADRNIGNIADTKSGDWRLMTKALTEKTNSIENNGFLKNQESDSTEGHPPVITPHSPLKPVDNYLIGEPEDEYDIHEKTGRKIPKKSTLI